MEFDWICTDGHCDYLGGVCGSVIGGTGGSGPCAGGRSRLATAFDLPYCRSYLARLSNSVCTCFFMRT